MGLRTIKIGAREAVEIACDNAAHRGEQRTAWFDCGSDLNNFELATAAGWSERRDAREAWLCPQCARKNALENDHIDDRVHTSGLVVEEAA